MPPAPQEENAWLDEWVHSIALGQAAMSPGDWWPFNAWAFEAVISDAWVEKWLEVIRRVEDQEPDLHKLGALVVPSLWRKELRFLSWDCKIWNYDKETRMELAKFFNKVLGAVYDQDHFGLESNMPTAYPAVIKAKNATWQSADSESAKTIGRLSSSCPSLAWSLYTDYYYSNAYDMMGLYPAPEFGPESTLMVKKFGKFKIPELWAQTSTYEYDEIIVGCIYRKLIGRFDIINHFSTNESLAQKMTHFYVSADGKPVVQRDEMEKIQQTIGRYAAAQFPALGKLSAEELKRKGAEIKFHPFKAVFDSLKMDWKPPTQILDRMDGIDYPDVRLPSDPSFDGRTLQWKTMTDPRIDFPTSERRHWDEWTAKLRT